MRLSPARWLRAAVTVAVACQAAPLAARVQASSDYTKAQTYSGALRYLRVDLGYEVVERDPDAAYLIFRYAPPGQNKANASGTLEVIEANDQVRLVVNLPRMPEYHERMLRDGLLKKLREEYGAPPRRSDPKPKPPEGPPESKPGEGAEPG